jgi:hypothetical protein
MARAWTIITKCAWGRIIIYITWGITIHLVKWTCGRSIIVVIITWLWGEAIFHNHQIVVMLDTLMCLLLGLIIIIIEDPPIYQIEVQPNIKGGLITQRLIKYVSSLAIKMYAFLLRLNCIFSSNAWEKPTSTIHHIWK